ncbi:MAG: hypothetical protein CMK71_12340 [Pseudomonadaceae bacterium]|nr:hypothetical protein [Pseudomonadaceae bacterium]|tara:strand:- start:545 stop:733 length:189 start_codon:yes stop_codon:yes gene_type:complete
MTLPSYPSYKDSGSTWLAEVPEHWAVMALKYLTYMKGRIGFRGYTTEFNRYLSEAFTSQNFG